MDGYPDDNPPIASGYTAEEYLGRLYGSKLSNPLNPPPSHFGLSVKELAYRRFGFSPRPSQNLRGPASAVKFAREVLGVSKAPVDFELNDSEAMAFIELLDGVTEAKSWKDLPLTMDILDPENWIHQPWPFT
ncbi:hypothetical protein V5O48_019414, partial [Marasmius crinis-equi]